MVQINRVNTHIVPNRFEYHAPGSLDEATGLPQPGDSSLIVFLASASTDDYQETPENFTGLVSHERRGGPDGDARVEDDVGVQHAVGADGAARPDRATRADRRRYT